MRTSAYPRVLRLACILGLVSLSFIIWSLLDPRWLSVVVAMSVGQAIGTMSLGAFLLVVIADLKREQRDLPSEPRDSVRPEDRVRSG